MRLQSLLASFMLKKIAEEKNDNDNKIRTQDLTDPSIVIHYTYLHTASVSTLGILITAKCQHYYTVQNLLPYMPTIHTYIGVHTVHVFT